MVVIIGKGPDGGFAVKRVELDESLAIRASNAIEQAKAIIEVNDDASLDAGIEALSVLTDAYGAIETSRKTIKEPFKKAVAMIDKEPKKYTDPLQVQIDRLKHEVGTYQAEKIRLAEFRRAEMERQSRELERAALATEDPERQEKLEEASHELHLAARTIERPTVAGATVRPTYVARLDDFVKVANSNPRLLKQELNTSAVNDMIRILSDGGKKPIASDAIPGITLIASAVVGIRR